MNVNKTISFLSAWICIVLIGLDIPLVTYSFPFYSSSSTNRVNRKRLPSKSSNVIAPIPITYELDAWARYDNPEEGKSLEGDIRTQCLRKTSTTDESLIWPKGLVPYMVDDTITNEPEKLAVLEEAIDNIMKLTCIRFIRIYADKNGKIPVDNWVNITGHEKGCSSDLGRSSYGPTNINLDVEKCFRVKGHALHEILHTLGIYHEHTRPDRDEHIHILWDNIKQGNAFNFQIMDDAAVTSYGLPYDYDSVMHYSMTAFSKNRSIPTILPRKKNVRIGQRNHLSSYDVKKLQLTYKCNTADYKASKVKKNRLAHDNRVLRNSNRAGNSRVASLRRSLYGSQDLTKKHQYSEPIETLQEASIPNMWPGYHNYEYYYDTNYWPNDMVADNFYYYEQI